MEHTSVESSNIASLAHCPDTQTLQVKFKGSKDKRGNESPSRIYEYVGVPAWVYTALKNAPSIGSYFASQIKGRYSGSPVPPPIESTPQVEKS